VDSGPFVIVKGWQCRIKLEGGFSLVLIIAFPIISSYMYMQAILLYLDKSTDLI